MSTPLATDGPILKFATDPPARTGNHDYDRHFQKPTAWRRAKEAIGVKTDFCRAMIELEAVAGGVSVRYVLELAINRFIENHPDYRSAATRDQNNYVGHSNPRGWWNAKKAFGLDSSLAKAIREFLEGCALAAPAEGDNGPFRFSDYWKRA